MEKKITFEKMDEVTRALIVEDELNKKLDKKIKEVENLKGEIKAYKDLIDVLRKELKDEIIKNLKGMKEE